MMKNILYVFNPGRKARLSSDIAGPEDFFYGYGTFKKKGYSTELLELSEKPNVTLSPIFKIIRKLSKIPIYTEKLVSIDNIKKIFHSDTIIATNQNVGYSLFPLLLILRFVKKFNFLILSMGMIENINNKWLNKLIINKTIHLSKKIIVISKNEIIKARKLFPKYFDKFIYIPFCIDTNFWTSESKTTQKNKVLFIGNDKFRDYLFLEKLALAMPEINFTFLTTNISSTKCANINLINGRWNDSKFSDKEVRQLYEENYITILPLLESYQPSGQSVALQSMSMGVPVLITETAGFWDTELLISNENIILVEKNDVNLWKRTITDLISNKTMYKKIANNGKKIVSEQFNLDKFIEQISKLV